uniref:GGDEF domain-containing protein n=1 Tax=Ditylenchus dipsaci TaxID=166011 RepID=A0A915DTU7_9BILA
MLAHSQALKTIYEKRLALQQIWARTSANGHDMLAAIKDWVHEAETSGIQALRDFAAQLKTYSLRPLVARECQRGALGFRLGNTRSAVRKPCLRAHLRPPGQPGTGRLQRVARQHLPDDLEYAERSLAQVLLKSAVEDREYRIINADGQVRCARENGTPLAFLLLDIDDFKQINDSYGHQEGDQVLQHIADSGKAVLRRGDLFGRIGGEEFAAVFPGCSAELAGQIAERLQRQIQRLSFSHGAHTYGVTVSQGLTGLTGEDVALDSLYARADAAMYQAKRRARTRSCAPRAANWFRGSPPCATGSAPASPSSANALSCHCNLRQPLLSR